MQLLEDRRAQSMTMLKAGGTIILFSGLYAVFQEPVRKMLKAGADVSTTSQAATGHQYISQIWTWLPLAAMGLIVLWLLSSAIFASGGVR